MLGNLKIYTGEEHFNAYAVFLREMGAPLVPHEQALWIFRVVLLVAVGLHMVAALQLSQQSWAARPVAYGQRESVAASYAARTMRWGGVIVGLFVIYHLLHFTLGVVGYAPGQFKHLSVYRNVITGFRVWYVSAFYIVAQVALGLHLQHGVWSLVQTLGVTGARASHVWRSLAWVRWRRRSVLGNVSIPVAVLAGLVRRAARAGPGPIRPAG